MFPVSIALLGLAFMCCALVVTGLPPLSGFVAKLSLLTAVLGTEGGTQASAGTDTSSARWMIFGLLLLSGLAATISLSRAGIRRFWSPGRRFAPHLKGVEAIAVVGLISSCILLTVCAESVMRYTRVTATGLHARRSYIEAVLLTNARPGPTQSTPQREGFP